VHQLRLELIEEHLIVDRAVVHGVPAVIDVLSKRGDRHQRPAANAATPAGLLARACGLSFPHRTSRNIPASM
jgi:hypothetical protein